MPKTKSLISNNPLTGKYLNVDFEYLILSFLTLGNAVVYL